MGSFYSSGLPPLPSRKVYVPQNSNINGILKQVLQTEREYLIHMIKLYLLRGGGIFRLMSIKLRRMNGPIQTEHMRNELHEIYISIKNIHSNKK